MVVFHHSWGWLGKGQGEQGVNLLTKGKEAKFACMKEVEITRSLYGGV